MSPIEELIKEFEEFQQACKIVLPGVARHLIEDLILHQQEVPKAEYMYKIESLQGKIRMSIKSKMQYG